MENALKKTLNRMMRITSLLVTLTLTSSVVLAGKNKIIPLKQAKLIIEHNATDNDTGFQGFIDSNGWQKIKIIGPQGEILIFESRGGLGHLGLTELFFETVEPENKVVSIEDMFAKLPPGKYRVKGTTLEKDDSKGETTGIAWLTHNVPEGSTLLSPKQNARVAADDVVMSWSPVTKSITGSPVVIIAYQLIVEKIAEPHPHMIGKRGLSMYLPSSVTKIHIPKGFLEPGTSYSWEVLAIEESGNQTLTSSEFETQ